MSKYDRFWENCKVCAVVKKSDRQMLIIIYFRRPDSNAAAKDGPLVGNIISVKGWMIVEDV